MSINVIATAISRIEGDENRADGVEREKRGDNKHCAAFEALVL